MSFSESDVHRLNLWRRLTIYSRYSNIKFGSGALMGQAGLMGISNTHSETFILAGFCEI